MARVGEFRERAKGVSRELGRGRGKEREDRGSGVGEKSEREIKVREGSWGVPVRRRGQREGSWGEF